jgi:site-specific recombinase XerD
MGDDRFDRLEREDIVCLVEWIHSRGSAPSTVADYKQVLKQFYKWHNGGEESELAEWIRRGPVSFHQILPRNLLTLDNVSQLINSCVNDRDRAFIALL